MEDAGESETTVTTAVSTGTDRATLSLTVIPQFSQHTRSKITMTTWAG